MKCHAFTKIIKIMSDLNSIWSDSLVVITWYNNNPHKPYKPGSNLGGETFFMIVKCMHSYLIQDCSYILCNSVIIFPSFHLDIHYSLGFINSFLDRAIFCCLLIAFANNLDPGQY